MVVWEPRGGRGGGHQLALDKLKAERISIQLGQQRPDDMIKIMSADAYAAAAVLERQQPRRRA